MSGGFLDAQAGSRKSAGIALSVGGHLAVVAALALHWQFRAKPVAAPPAPLMIELLPLAAPPVPAQELPPGPVQVEREEAKPQPVPAPLTIVPSFSPATPPIPPTRQVDPGPPAPATTSPKAIPAPPARQMASESRPSWEARLLAHLEKFRRYPGNARARREQGVALVRFRMTRQGRLLSATLQHSSGAATLDRAALDTLRRAQPLPAIPADMPEEMELAVPVEFFLAG